MPTVRHWYFLNPEGDRRIYVLPEKGSLRASARLQRAGWERVSRKWLKYAMAEPAFDALMSAPEEGEYTWTGERLPATCNRERMRRVRGRRSCQPS